MANFYPPGFENEIKSIAIDFDGVLHDAYQGWGDGTCYGDPLPGAIEAIKQLSKQYQIIIFTAKAKPDRPLVDGKTGAELIWKWLEKYNIKECFSEITAEKPRCLFYVDDKAIRFINWENALSSIENFK